MRSDAKLASPLSALASAALHALLLASGIVISAHTTPDSAHVPLDNWAARSVEVGTVPDGAHRQEPAPDDVRKPPNPALPKAPTAAKAPSAPKALAGPKAEHGQEVTQRRPSNGAATAQAAAASRGAAAQTAAAPPATAQSGVESAGSMGTVGLPPGVRHLATAFARALPAGGYRDAAWSELPLGKVGDAVVSLSVTDAGQLDTVEVDPEHGLSPAFDHMLKRVVLLLKSGTFSLDPRKVTGGGTEHIEVEVTLSTRPANPDQLAAPGDLYAQSFAPPKHDQPGYARFTLNSGRHVEAVVRFAKPSQRPR